MTDEPPVHVDRCVYCKHSWHGITCTCVVARVGSSRACNCSSSIPEFRAERVSA